MGVHTGIGLDYATDIETNPDHDQVVKNTNDIQTLNSEVANLQHPSFSDIQGDPTANTNLKTILDSKASNDSVTNAGKTSEWGSITGTLANQSDLNTALSSKADSSSLSAYAKTSDVNTELAKKPTATLSVDSTIATPSDTSVLSSKAVKTYADTKTTESQVNSLIATQINSLPKFLAFSINIGDIGTGTTVTVNGVTGDVPTAIKTNDSTAKISYIAVTLKNKLSSANYMVNGSLITDNQSDAENISVSTLFPVFYNKTDSSFDILISESENGKDQNVTLDFFIII